tara:strand:+ start:19350 stop:20318 length:969 start_codon:yes stop_codon:yes gene_type:complete
MKGGVSKIKLKSKTTKKQHTLLLFLMISTLFWLLTKLSKEYETKIVYAVNYINLPSSKLFQNTPETTVELVVRSTGFNLLQEKFKKGNINIGLRNVVSNGAYSYYLLSNIKHNAVQSQLEKKIELIGFSKDTLFFELGFNKRKKVPIITNFSFRFKSGYNLSNDIIVRPDSIEVSGPEIQVDKINSIKTSQLQIEDIVDDMYYEIPLLKHAELNKLNYSHDQVQVIGQVEKFTEDSFHVSFEIIGLPVNTTITTYPKTVEVVYQVGLSNYKKIAASDFKIICNYKKSASENTRFLIPELIKKPTLVSSIKMIPNHIEYLIQK